MKIYEFIETETNIEKLRTEVKKILDVYNKKNTTN